MNRKPGNRALSLHDDAADGLTVRIHRRIHANLSLDVELGLGREVGVVFGKSGVGKTTLLRLIAGLVLPDTGRIVLDRRVVFDSTERVSRPLRDRAIGLIFQDDLLFPHLSVRDNIGFGLKRWSKNRAVARIGEIARLCGVEHLLGRRPETLSGGERQRIGLARSLAPRPRLLLCDEPVSALDFAGRNALIDRLKAVQRSEKIPILYVTHSPAEAISLGDTLFLLDQGRIVEQGAPLEILSRIRDGALNHWEGVRNVFSALVTGHAPNREATFLGVHGGPTLQVPALDQSPGSPVTVEIHASDIIIANGPGVGLSAQNLISGVVEKVVSHGAEAEVIVRTDEVYWIASVVVSAVIQLGLASGSAVYLIIKARSCRVMTI